MARTYRPNRRYAKSLSGRALRLSKARTWPLLAAMNRFRLSRGTATFERTVFADPYSPAMATTGWLERQCILCTCWSRHGCQGRCGSCRWNCSLTQPALSSGLQGGRDDRGDPFARCHQSERLDAITQCARTATPPTLMIFPKPHPRPTAILGDEFDACSFQGASDCQIVGCCQGSGAICEFSTLNRA